MIRYREKKCIVCPRILVHFLGQVYLKSWAILFGHTVVRFMLVNNNIRHSLTCYFRLICKKNIKRKIRKIIYKNIFGKIIKTIETNLYFFRGLRRVNSSDYLSNKIKHFHYVVVVVYHVTIVAIGHGLLKKFWPLVIGCVLRTAGSSNVKNSEWRNKNQE